MFPQYSIGVSISDAKAFVVCLQRKLGKVRIYSQDVVDFHGAESLKSRLDILQSYLSDFREVHKVPNSDLFIGFPRARSILKIIELPLAVKENLQASIGYSLEKYLPLKSDDVYYDCNLLGEDKNGKTMQVMLGAAKKADMAPYVDFSVLGEIGVSGILFESLGAIDFIGYHRKTLFEENENVFIFFIGFSCIDTTFVQNQKIIHFRSFESRDQEHTIVAVKDEIERFVQFDNEGEFQACILFCGSGIDDSMINAMELDPKIIVKKEFFFYSQLRSEDYFAAAGLALGGIDDRTLGRINLLPVSKRRKASRKALYFMFALVASALILACVWGGGVIVKRNLMQARLDGQLTLFSEKARQINKKQERLAELESKVAAVNFLVETQISVNEILAELSRILPENAWLSGFVYSKGKKVRIDGFADTAAELIPIIENSALFENGSFLSAIMKTKEKKEKFLIGFDIVGQSE